MKFLSRMSEQLQRHYHKIKGHYFVTVKREVERIISPSQCINVDKEKTSQLVVHNIVFCKIVSKSE